MILERVRCPLWTIKHVNQRKQGFFFLKLWLFVLPPIYRFFSAASANSDSKNHMLLVVKELPECGLDILVLFFLFSKRFNTRILYLFALYIPFPPLFISIIIPVV